MIDPIPLNSPAYPDVGLALREGVDIILDRWAGLVATRLPAADHLTHSQLKDHLPKMLVAIAEAMVEAGTDPVAAVSALASNHGAERFHESYSVDELLIEFGMLRPIILDHLAAVLGRVLAAEELFPLNEGLDAAMRHSVDRFVADQSRRIQAVNEAHAKYLAYMSHDLRGGLNGIMLLADLLTRSLQDDTTARESVEDLTAMQGSISETMHAMDVFLQAERLRRGNVNALPVRTRLGDVVRRIAAHYAQRAKRKNVELRIEIDDDVVTEVDRELLSLILSNLLSNALRHSPAAEPIRLVVRYADDAAFARISVVDRGPGVSPQRQVGLFRAPVATDLEQGASGLVVAGQAAETIRAALSVDSTPHVGTAFHVTIAVTRTS